MLSACPVGTCADARRGGDIFPRPGEHAAEAKTPANRITGTAYLMQDFPAQPQRYHCLLRLNYFGTNLKSVMPSSSLPGM
jgi:hypothetical protein